MNYITLDEGIYRYIFLLGKYRLIIVIYSTLLNIINNVYLKKKKIDKIDKSTFLYSFILDYINLYKPKKKA